MIDLEHIKNLVEAKDAVSLAALVDSGDLKIVDGRLVADEVQLNETRAFLDKRQLVRKILLNSASLGALSQ